MDRGKAVFEQQRLLYQSLLEWLDKFESQFRESWSHGNENQPDYSVWGSILDRDCSSALRVTNMKKRSTEGDDISSAVLLWKEYAGIRLSGKW